MSKIDGIYTCSHYDFTEFNKMLQNAINTLQEKGQEVEVQYNTALSGELIVHSALVLGRK